MGRFSSSISYKIFEGFMLEVMWNRNSPDGLIHNIWKNKEIWFTHEFDMSLWSISTRHSQQQCCVSCHCQRELCRIWWLTCLDSTLYEWKLIYKNSLLSLDWIARTDSWLRFWNFSLYFHGFCAHTHFRPCGAKIKGDRT